MKTTMTNTAMTTPMTAMTAGTIEYIELHFICLKWEIERSKQDLLCFSGYLKIPLAVTKVTTTILAHRAGRRSHLAGIHGHRICYMPSNTAHPETTYF
jgi:hypothetical protein